MAKKVRLICEKCGEALAYFTRPMAEEWAEQKGGYSSNWLDHFDEVEWMPYWKGGYEDVNNELGDGWTLKDLREWTERTGRKPWLSNFDVDCPCGVHVRGRMEALMALVDPAFSSSRRLVNVPLSSSPVDHSGDAD